MGLVEHDVFADHFGDVAGFQKFAGEAVEDIGQPVVVPVGPIESLLEGLVAVVGVVLSVHTVADHEDLHVLKKGSAGTKGMLLVAIDLVEGFFEFQPTAFEFDLYQRQTVDKQRYIVAVLVLALHGHLVRDLELVLAPVLGVDELKIEVVAVVADDVLLLPQGLGLFEDRALAENIEDFLKFAGSERDPVVFFELGFQVGGELAFIP